MMRIMQSTSEKMGRWLAALAAVAALSAVGASAQTAAPVAANPPERLVLCWYMVCFGNSVEFYKQEIALAQQCGIDGFLLDVGAWEGGYIQSSERLFDAAKQLDSGFKLAFAPEYSVQPFGPKVRDMVVKFRDHPNHLRHDGKIVLSGYGSRNLFPPAVELLKSEGVPVCLVPNLFLPRFTYQPSFDAYAAEFAAMPALDGLMMFNAAQLSTTIADNAAARRATQKLGKICAAGVIPAYNSANLQDYRGLSGYLAMWRGAIDDGADWISLVIWNDYNEDSALMPARWPHGSEREHVSRDGSFLHATAFASAWFKSGRMPAITQDQFFVTYRNRSKWLRQAWDGKRWVDLCLQTDARYDQMHDDVADQVYIDTFLTAPAKLAVQIGKSRQILDLPAGLGHAAVPLVVGVPQLTLTRDGKMLADVLARKAIIDKPTEQNSQLGYHLANRTWVSGTAIGPVALRLEAESGSLTGGATVVTQDRVAAVRNETVRNSGFSVPVRGLTTGMYNVRISYANPGADEARLTLTADGPPRDPKEYPYFIPAFLPPTAKGAFQTVSFFWPLYATTTTLAIRWQPSLMWGQPQPLDDDRGSVLIDAIELVKVEAFVAPPPRDSRVPELVVIPGGAFTMGSEAGEPDEQPRHPVTLAGFALGKYEVTNAEFERFDPAHRQFRNGNSWRDREPVLHLSWVDAVRYCNWLSEQNGLTPAYAERPVDPAKPTGAKAWSADPAANGFRLPTEAQWEYVASGRGQNRRYPWGDATPVPGVHGRFLGAAALEPRLPRPSTEDAGVCVVGGHPAGASRDGVMDLAGNVAEWCEDWYAPYPADAQTDPNPTTPGNYRVIRGGSWSWYNHSQRCADREFNSQNYPGHAYYGLRVCLPEAGWQKLAKPQP